MNNEFIKNFEAFMQVTPENILQNAEYVVWAMMAISDESTDNLNELASIQTHLKSLFPKWKKVFAETVITIPNQIKLEDADLIVRAYNILKADGINSLNELENYTASEIKKMPFLGEKTFHHIKTLLLQNGLKFKNEQ